MGELKAGGFSFSWRRNVLEAATLGFSRVWAKEKQGKGFINRPGKSGIRSRFKKLCGKTSWYQQKSLKPKSADKIQIQETNAQNPGKRRNRNKPKYTECYVHSIYTWKHSEEEAVEPR